MAVIGSGGHLRGYAACALSMLAALVAAVAFPAAANAKVDSSFFGAATVVPPKPAELDGMADVGLGVYRMALLWREVEPRAPSADLLGPERNDYVWDRYDAEMRALAEAGLDAHVVLSGTPSWVSKTIHTSPWQSAKGRQNWPRFVGAVLDRYGSNGSFWLENPDLPRRPPIAYQIWNEPNSGFYYAPRADPVEYSRLFVSAADEIKAKDPGAEVVSGGMFGTPQGKTSIYSWPFLKRFLGEPGVAARLDAVGIHPYAGSLYGIKFQIRKFRQVLSAANMKRMPLQVTEIGWSSSLPDEQKTLFYQGPRGQAKLVKTSLKLLVNHRRQWRLERILWFTWADISKREARAIDCNFCPRMGLLNEKLAPKPAYRHFVAQIGKALSGRRR